MKLNRIEEKLKRAEGNHRKYLKIKPI